MNKVTLLQGDCLQKLKELEDNSIDSVVTDPPYGIGFMGKAWDTFDTKNVKKANKDATKSFDKTKEKKQNNPNLKGRKNAPIGGKATFAGTYDLTPKGTLAYQQFCEEWGRECLRVLKPGGYILSSCSPRMYHRMTVGLEDAGFEIRDQILWVYGSGFPKSHNVGNKLGEEYKGIGTALKPAHEPIVMGRKPFKGTVAQNVLEWGTGGINIDGCRIGNEGGTKKSDIEKVGDVATNFTIGKQNIKNKVEPLNEGRFPANIIFDDDTDVEWKRYFYCPKASKKDRDEGLDDIEAKSIKGRDENQDKLSNAFKARPTERKNIHPTVKPTDLMAYLVRLVTPKGGTVLDPFMGSGSTGKAALREGMNFIGIEREDEYMEISKSRIEHEQSKHKHKEFFG